MRQTCNDEYWKGMEAVLARNGDPENPGKPCGKTFDDLDHRTICPHEYFPPGPGYQPQPTTTKGKIEP